MNFSGIMLDLIVILFVVLSYLFMSKKGFVKALSSISSNVLTIILVAVLLTPVTEALSKTQLGDGIRDAVSTHIMKDSDADKSDYRDLSPEIMQKLENKGKQVTADLISGVLIRIASLVILVIAIKILLWLLFFILGKIVSFPVISWFNKVAGGVIGIANAILIIFIICGLSSLNIGWFKDLRGMIDQTIILKFFTTNNLLMNIFIH